MVKYISEITCLCAGPNYKLIIFFNYDNNAFYTYDNCILFHNDKKYSKQLTNYNNCEKNASYKLITIKDCTCSPYLPFLYNFEINVNDERMCYYVKNIEYGFPKNI